MRFTAKTILIFGSSFNPPTLAHEAIITACLQQPQFDEIWLMPSGDRLDKSMNTGDAHRLRMAEILKAKVFASSPRVQVSDLELSLPRPTETHHTAAALAERYPKHEFWWAFGTDTYLSMPSWANGAELQKTLKMLIFDRGGSGKIGGSNVVLISLPEMFIAVSSTDARRALAQGAPFDNLLSNPIAQYITANNLYN